jgi:NitT/TauT family transport system substrate-binding protein
MTAMVAMRKLVRRFHRTNHIDIIRQPRPEERAPERLSKDARVSKDGHKRDRARGHPSRRPRQERGLLRMRSEGLDSIVRCDWFYGIDPLTPVRFSAAAWRRLSLIALIAALLLHLATSSLALDTVRVGKAVPNSFAFGAAEVGIDAKIFAGEGLDVAVSSFRGDAQLQQALAAGSVDVGLGSGPGLGFRVKGAPMIGVAAMYGAPRNLALLVSAKSPIRSVADLKGKRIGVTTVGSLTDWLVRELSRQQGWGSDGIVIAPLGQMQARLAAMDRGELDGVVLEAANGYELEEAGRTRNLILFGDIVKHFYTHVIFATDEMVDKRPALLQRFLRSWFKTVAFMKANREFTVKSEQRTLDVRQSVVEKIYDAQIAGFSLDGAWDPEAIDVIRSSLKELGILPIVPEAKALYTDRFVPVRF